MAQAKALDALEPFLALSKSATSPRAAADLVARATSHPNTFVFAELLQTPQVKALATADAELAAYLTLLKIFSYGTYADYERGSISPSTSSSTESQTTDAPPPPPPPQAPQTTLPTLNDVQNRKLRQLSLISLANNRASLNYDHLIRELRLKDARELETLVVSAIYAGLVSATLDPAHKVVRIASVAPVRDVAPGEVPKLRLALQEWSGRCETTLADIDAQIAEVRKAATERADKKRQWDCRFREALREENKSTQWDPNSGNGGGKKAAGSSPVMSRVKQRFMKRGSNLMAESAGGGSGAGASGTAGGGGAGGAAALDDDESMDVDDDDLSGSEANKRANRRKL